MRVYSYGDNESLLRDDSKVFYDQYYNLSKDEILTVAKQKKAFLNKINVDNRSVGQEFIQLINFRICHNHIGNSN